MCVKCCDAFGVNSHVDEYLYVYTLEEGMFIVVLLLMGLSCGQSEDELLAIKLEQAVREQGRLSGLDPLLVRTSIGSSLLLGSFGDKCRRRVKVSLSGCYRVVVLMS